MDSEADQEASLTKVQDKLEHLSKRVGELSELIDKITQEFLEDHLTKSDQIERAKVYHVLAFIINALSFGMIAHFCSGHF